MKTIELSEYLAQAPVVENLKNFTGIDAANAVGMMTPERLAAVAGGKIKEIGGCFYTDTMWGKSEIQADDYVEMAKDIVYRLPQGKHIMFSILYIKNGVKKVEGQLYHDLKHGRFDFKFVSGSSAQVLIENGVFTLK